MLAPWNKSHDQPRQHIKNQRRYIANKCLSSQNWFFSVVMYGCESWTIKKVECWRNDALKLWCWRRLLRVPLDCKEIKPVHPKGNQPWIFTGRADVEAPILWPPDAKIQLRERLRAGGERGDRGRDGWMASLTHWTLVWASSGSWWRTGKTGVLQSKRWQRVEHDWETELNWLPYMQKSCFLKILSQNLNFFPLHTFISKYLDKGMNE